MMAMMILIIRRKHVNHRHNTKYNSKYIHEEQQHQQQRQQRDNDDDDNDNNNSNNSDSIHNKHNNAKTHL